MRPCPIQLDTLTTATVQPARRRPPRAGAFSLLETTLAVSILGIGLIMVAAIFPVALWQHRDSVYQARATELASKAESVLRARLDSNRLWRKPGLAEALLDSPWYVVPFQNLGVGGAWDPINQALIHGNRLNFAPDTASSLVLPGSTLLSDRFAPWNDAEAMQTSNRVVWYGFYRCLANGTVNYAAALCRQQRNQIFAEQNAAILDFYLTPTASLDNFQTDTCRLPTPWRVTVSRAVGSNRLYNQLGPEGLGELAPVGSKIMIHGATYPAVLQVPAGRILTVSNVINQWTIEVREDVSDLPTGAADFFDVWLFPPPVIGGNSQDAAFSKESPLIDWKVFL